MDNNKTKNNNTEGYRQFTFDVPQNDYEEDDYEKMLVKDIEENCNFNSYVNKLEIEERTDEELLLLSKEEILQFKNNQIVRLKAYIVSLEHEKEDLIENYKETTSQLLDKVKDSEEEAKGYRPETPMITRGLNRKKGGVSEGDFCDVGNKKKKIQRCPNCAREFPENEFVSHSLQCLRKTFHCKSCGELIDESNRKSHNDQYLNTKSILKAIDSNDDKGFKSSLDHGFITNSILIPSTFECAIHLIVKGNKLSLLTMLLNSKDKDIDYNLQTKNQDTPLTIAIEERNEKIAMLLLRKGAEFNIRTKGDMSPLMLSCKHNLIAIVKALLALGADINESNVLAYTPLKIAQMYHHEDLAMILLKEFNASIGLKK